VPETPVPLSEVAVTGVGVVSPLGCTAESAFEAALKGECGITMLPRQEHPDLPVRVSARVDDGQVPGLTEPEWRGMDRGVALGLSAVRQAWQMAGSPTPEPTRLAVSLSSGMGSFLSLDTSLQRFHQGGARAVLASTVPRTMANALAAVSAIELGAQAGTFALVSACSSGTDCIAHAVRLIRSGEADMVVTGGSEAVLHPSVVASFDRLRALSHQDEDPAMASRPFDRDRDGFVLGEGAAVLVLERLDHARARDAKVLATVTGAGVTSDAAHIVAPDPTGRMAAAAMLGALRSGGLGPQDVAAVSAHATGTRVGDAAEAAAVSQVFGDQTGQVPITALKSMSGHLVGASGPLATVMAVFSVSTQQLTPTPNFQRADPDCPLDIVGAEYRPLPRRGAGVILVNSFGFGGQNVSLCIGP
jgi:3-oxoacyl-[acyl-carrier-protein] synthase II